MKRMICCAPVSACIVHHPEFTPCKCMACFPHVYEWAVRGRCDICEDEIFIAPSSIDLKRKEGDLLVCKPCSEKHMAMTGQQTIGPTPHDGSVAPWEVKPQ